MTGGIQHLDGEIAHFHGVALVIEPGFAHGDKGIAHISVAGLAAIFGVDIHRGTGVFLQICHAHGVVHVTVGEQNGHTLHVVALQIVQNHVGISAGVDDGGFHCGLIGENVAVGADEADLHGFNQH